MAWTSVRGREVVLRRARRERWPLDTIEEVVAPDVAGVERERGSAVRFVCFLRILRVASELASENYWEGYVSG
jgi:hypothetical protein